MPSQKLRPVQKSAPGLIALKRRIVLPWLPIYSCFVDFMMSLTDDKKGDIIDTFNTTSRYFGDI